MIAVVVVVVVVVIVVIVVFIIVVIVGPVPSNVFHVQAVGTRSTRTSMSICPASAPASAAA